MRANLRSLIGAELDGVFSCMDLAEEVLMAMGDPPGAFGILCPSEVLTGKAGWLFKAHAVELV